MRAARSRAAGFFLRVGDQRSWRLTGEFTWVLLGQGGALLGSIALTKVIASGLGAEQYGRFALALTVAVVLNQFIFGPISTSTLRFFASYSERNRLRAFLGGVGQLVGSAVGLLTVLVATLSVLVWRAFGVEWAMLLVLAVAYGIAQNVFSLVNTLDIGARRRRRAAMFQAADPAMRLLLVVVVLLMAAHTASSAMLGISVGMAAVTVWQLVLFGRGLDLTTDAGSREERAADRAAVVSNLLGYGKFFVIAGVFTSLQLSSDRWALKIFLDDTTVGMYAAAYQLASVPAVVVAGCLSQFLSPIVFQRAKDGRSLAGIAAARHAILIGALALGLLIAGSTIVAVFLGEPLVVLFTSAAYRGSGAYVAPLLLGLGLMQIGHMLGLVALSINRLKGHLAVRIVHGVVAVAINVVAVSRYGVTGLCWAAVLSGGLYVALVMMNNARLLRTFSAASGGAQTA